MNSLTLRRVFQPEGKEVANAVGVLKLDPFCHSYTGVHGLKGSMVGLMGPFWVLRINSGSHWCILVLKGPHWASS